MNSVIIFLILIIFVLVVWAVYQHSRVIISGRLLYDKMRQIKKERESTAAILGLSGKAISSTDMSDETFLTHFLEYAQRSLQGIGAAAVTVENGTFKGCAVSGIFPPLKEVPLQVEQQLLAHPKKHTEFIKEIKIPFTISEVEEMCADKKFAFFKDDAPRGFSPGFKKLAPRILISPIYIRSKIFACVIVVSRNEFDEYALVEKDGEYLVQLNEIASLSLEGIKVFRQRRDYEEKLQNAREEGMLQVSTGIIHNIGNAVTVAKLTVLELQEKNPKHSENPETLISKEILPVLKKNFETGTLESFLREDKAGKQYFEIISGLLDHINDGRKETVRLLDSLSGKLYHMSEIVELQQRFMGELGTENITALGPVIESSIKIFEETCNKKGVKIRTSIDVGAPEVLVDPSMMTQVFINLIKNAVEAMEADPTPQKEHIMEIVLRQEQEKERNFSSVIIEVKDNGPGIDGEIREKIFNFGFSTKERSRTSRGYGLHSCRETVRKYGGAISVESETGKGSTFKISLPVKERKK